MAPTPFSVPTVDLTGPDAGTALAAALTAASCAFVRGHGVDLGLRLDVREVSRAFFDLPRERKAEVRWPGDGLWRGWQPVQEGADDLTGTRVPDLVERFEAQDLERFILWPAEPAGFADLWRAYYAECAELASRLMSLLAPALDLPAEDLPAWTDRQFANLVVNDYPAQPDPPLPGQVRVGSHTDRGGFTLLWADAAPGGLEVRPPGSDGWAPVAFPDDVFLVQAGDLLARWTNNVIRANVHRVVNPPRAMAATARRSAVVYFHYPALDATVTPAPSCVGDRAPLPPLVTGDHLLRRQAAFRYRADESYATT